MIAGFTPIAIKGSANTESVVDNPPIPEAFNPQRSVVAIPKIINGFPPDIEKSKILSTICVKPGVALMTEPIATIAEAFTAVTAALLTESVKIF